MKSVAAGTAPAGNAVELSSNTPSPTGGGLGWGQVESVASLRFDRPPPNLPPLGGGTHSTAFASPGGQVVFNRASNTHNANNDGYAITYTAPDGSTTPLYYTNGRLVSVLEQANPAINLYTSYAPNSPSSAPAVQPALYGSVNGNQAIGLNLDEQSQNENTTSQTIGKYLAQYGKILGISVGTALGGAVVIILIAKFVSYVKGKIDEAGGSNQQEGNPEPNKIEYVDKASGYIKEVDDLDHTNHLESKSYIEGQKLIDQLISEIHANKKYYELTDYERSALRALQKLNPVNAENDESIQESVRRIRNDIQINKQQTSLKQGSEKSGQPVNKTVNKPPYTDWRKLPEEQLKSIIADITKSISKFSYSADLLRFKEHYFNSLKDDYWTNEFNKFLLEIDEPLKLQFEIDSLSKTLITIENPETHKYLKTVDQATRKMIHEDIRKIRDINPFDPFSKKAISDISNKWQNILSDKDKETWGEKSALQEKLFEQRLQIEQLQVIDNTPETRELLTENQYNYYELNSLAFNPHNPEPFLTGMASVEIKYQATNVKLLECQKASGETITLNLQPKGKIKAIEPSNEKDEEPDGRPDVFVE